MTAHPGDDLDAPPDTDDMIMIHASFRREFALAPRLVETTRATDPARARRVTDHLALMVQSLHDHHAGEDAVLWPALRATGKVDAGLLEQMLGEHHQLATELERLEQARLAWAREPHDANAQRLTAVLSRVETEVMNHLDHEEAQALPLVREHLTTRDWNDLGAESRRRLPRSPRRQLLLLGVLLEDATPAQRRRVDEQMPTPVRWLWRTAGRRFYLRYVRQLRAPAGS